ncbi:KI18B protein, partial [Syrrhaptes paradoxus]|nr:KI18B protein [Syrrhaptes paradoxus]
MALAPPPEEGTVSVMVRVRPPAPCECERAAHPILHVVDQHVLVFDPEEPAGPPSSALPARGPKQQGKGMKFIFDRVFGETATQEEVFQHTTHGVLDSVLNGYNCSVFAYGATGAGKTYTMLGSEKSPGIMYLTMVELYMRIEARKEEKSCQVLVSYQEVYNEQIHDLLEPKGPLAIREDPEKGVVVQGLSFHQPTSAQQLLEMLANGNKNRTQHPTDANASSSRSHAIFQVYVKQQDCVGGLTRDLRVAKMSLIDLAGSERASVTNAKGERLREGANINRSLLALINVINALADAKSKKTHIPYRDSKLTRLLKDSIGGNCRTIMIAAVSPSVLAYEDTYNTLKYASRAKEIKLSLKSNVVSSDDPVSEYAAMCEQLKAEVADLRAKLCAYEDAARVAQTPAPLAPLTSSTLELPRVEEAVLEVGSDLEDPRESGGEQQELEAGCPAELQMELEEAPEEMPPSTPRTTQQTDLQLEPKKPSCLLQGSSGSQPETLFAAILSLARRQYSLLKAANLLTPDMVAEFEELERLVHQEPGVNVGQAASPNRTVELGEATPAQGMQQDGDSDGEDLGQQVLSPLLCLAKASVTVLPLLSSPTLLSLSPIKNRKRSETISSPHPGSPHSLRRPMKRSWSGGKEAESPRAPQSPGTSCPKATTPAPPVSPLPSCCTPKVAPPLATKSRVPLATSAAQNRCALPTLPTNKLNVTFEICEIGSSPSAAGSLPEFPACENVQSPLTKRDRTFAPK